MKRSAMLWAYVLFFYLICITNAENAKVLVKMGTQKCLSKCTFEPTGTDRYFDCSVYECRMHRNLPRSLNPAERPEIEKTATLYIYTDSTTGENKLGLEFSWTPSDDRTVEELTGYLIEVKDNNEKSQASYSKCYNITTKLSFMKHKRTLFKDDCFGKDNSVEIKPGSTLTVSVTSLPLFDSNPRNTMSSIIVQIPDCNDARLADLTTCKSTGRSVEVREETDQCAQNCSTTAIGVDGLPHYITCTTSKSHTDIFTLKPENCDAVNKTVTGTPSRPDIVTGRDNWYIYYDPDSGETKVALNFSWSPADDSSISSLVGYYMEILSKASVGVSKFYNKCFTIHTVLNEDDHKAAEFFYDCYGRDTMEVIPGEKFLVHLESRPHSATSQSSSTTIHIDVPDCAHEAMKTVTYCTDFHKLYREGTVEKVFCNNRSVQYTYALAPEYGDWATVLLCEKGEGLNVCKNNLATYDYLAHNGTLYNISIASHANLSIPYVVLLYGNKVPERTPTDISFKECVLPISNPMMFAIIFVVVAFVIFSIIILFLCVWRRTNCETSKILGKYFTCCVKNKGSPAQGTAYTNGQVNDNSRANELQVLPLPPKKELEKIPDNVRIYVIYKEDHELHRETVYWFCCYLKKDLGLDVRMYKWEENVASANPIVYMHTNLAQADKVIIICSEGTRNSLNDQEWKGDMFTPVLRKIYQESFLGKNPSKFLVGYFDYSSVKDVPAMLHDQAVMYCSEYHLMKQFEQFYFRLTGVEQFQEGGIKRIEKIAFDRYYDPKLTSYGSKLKSSIDNMKAVVTKNPTWYVDQEGEDMAVVDMPSMPPPDNSISEMPSINMLHISQPPEVTGARPKKVSNSPQDSRIEINEEIDTIVRAEPKNIENHFLPTEPKIAGIGDDIAMSETRVKEFYEEPEPPARWPMEHDDDDDVPPLIPSVAFSSVSDYGSSRPLFNSNISQGTSFCLASDFSNRSKPDDSASFLLDELASQETQITRLGLPESSDFPQVPETNSLMNLSVPPLIHDKEEVPAESGVFTFTQIEDCELADFEDQIKSINQMLATSELELQNVGLESV